MAASWRLGVELMISLSRTFNTRFNISMVWFYSARPPNVMAESRHDEEAAIVDAIDGTTFRKSMVISLLLQLLESVREDVGDSGMQPPTTRR